MIEEGLTYDAGQVHRWAERLLARSSGLHERIIERRLHYNNDPRMDPRIGEYTSDGHPVANDPYADVARFQSDTPRRVAQQVVARLCENPAIFDVDARKQSADGDASEAAIIFNEWKSEIELRTGINWQQALSYGQVKDCYGLIHTYRLDHFRPPVPLIRYESEEKIPEDVRDQFIEDPDADSGYVEVNDAWKKRRNEIYADAGCPWQVEFPDPIFFAGQRDRIGPGYQCAVLAYEVDAFEYDMALKGSSGDMPTPLDTQTPAPGLEQGRSVGSGATSFETPSSSDYEDRRRVWQFWTRTEYYELAEYTEQAQKRRRNARGQFESSKGIGAMRLVKAFKHDYPGVPFEIAWANRTYDLDPVWEAEPYLEGVYRLKPFWDYMMTRTAAIMELTANPPLIEQDTPGAPTNVLESGDIAEEDSESMLGGRLPAGRNMKQIQVQATAGISQILQLLTAMLQQAEPPTGTVEIGASTAPWTARIWQTQANIGPKVLVENQAYAFRWLGEFWRQWHVAHPDEPFISSIQPATARKHKRSAGTAEVKPEALAKLRVEATIGSLSSAEKLTVAEHLAGFLERGLITEEELFEDGFGHRDAAGYAVKLRVANATKPYKIKLLETMLAGRMAAMFTRDTNGNIADMTGKQVDEIEVLEHNGYKVPRLPGDPGSQAPRDSNPISGSTLRRGDNATLPLDGGSLPGLKAPGTMELTGARM